MPDTPEITIVTLFAGRFHLLPVYFHSLDNLDYPKNNLHLLWLTNNPNYLFHECLARELQKRQENYASIKLIISDDIPSSPLALAEKGKGYGEHAKVIARLYNLAFSHVKTPYFFTLEDDVAIPPYILQIFLKHFTDYPQAAYVTGAIFDRHKNETNGLFAWSLKRVKRKVKKANREKNKVKLDWLGAEIIQPWGIKTDILSTLAHTLIKTEAIQKIKKPIFKHRHNKSTSLLGCDLVLCLDLALLGHQRILDFSIRSLHYDSELHPH